MKTSLQLTLAACALLVCNAALAEPATARKAQLERGGKVEVMGEIAPKTPEVINKPPTKSPAKP